MPWVLLDVSMATLTYFLPMHTANSKLTRLTPTQSTSQGLPELRIQKRFFRGHEERGLVIFSRPCGIIVRGSFVVGVHAVRTVEVVAPFEGCLHRFLGRY